MSDKGEKARQNILAAAEKLFAKKGFDATSVESIAKAAKVNKALIYYYFKDKNHIVQSLFQDILDQLAEHLRSSSLSPEDLSGHPDLTAKMAREIAFLQKRSRIISILLMEALKGGDQDNFLFQCAEMVINHEMEAYKESFAAKKRKMPDPTQYMVFEFFTGFIPILAFIVFGEKWRKHYQIPEDRLTGMFLEAFTKTHLASH